MRFSILFALALFTLACGGGATPRTPTSPDPSPSPNPNPNPGAQTCRNVPTRYSVTTTSALSTSVVSWVCTIDTATVTITCTATTQAPPCTGTGTQVSRWASIADLVDEGAVIGRSLFLESTTQQVTSCSGTNVPSDGSTRQTFDGQRRLVRGETRSTSPGVDATAVSVYSAWDAQGRPTAWTTTVTPGNGSLQFSAAFDDAARTVTQTQTSNSPPSTGTATTSFNADNNPISARTTSSIAPPLDFVYTYESVQRVCK
jgi:hypothetical protein